MVRILTSRISITAVVMLVLLSGLRPAAGQEGRWLVPRTLAAENGLKIVWQFNLPFNDGEHLDRLFVLGDCAYAMSSRNYLTCIDAKGTVKFSSFIVSPGLPVGEFIFNSQRLISVIGNELVEINSEFGTRESSVTLDDPATCPVVRNSAHTYIAASDNRVHVLRVEDRVKVFDVAAENGEAIVALTADDDSVIFATAAGNIVCFAADSPRKLWQFDVPGKIVGGIVRDANEVYVASNNTNVYKIDGITGKLVWKYQAAAALASAPQVSKALVYQRVADKGVVAIGRESGKLVWELPDGMGIAGESADRTFVIAGQTALVIMDNNKARQSRRVEFGIPLKFAANIANPTIYIGDEAGRLACLHPAE